MSLLRILSLLLLCAVEAGAMDYALRFDGSELASLSRPLADSQLAGQTFTLQARRYGERMRRGPIVMAHPTAPWTYRRIHLLAFSILSGRRHGCGLRAPRAT